MKTTDIEHRLDPDQSPSRPNSNEPTTSGDEEESKKGKLNAIQ